MCSELANDHQFQMKNVFEDNLNKIIGGKPFLSVTVGGTTSLK